MEQTWQERLAEILAKEPSGVTPGDAEFLRARRSYLTPDQAKTYAAVLNPEVGVDESEKQLEAEKPKKKKKDE